MIYGNDDLSVRLNESNSGKSATHKHDNGDELRQEQGFGDVSKDSLVVPA
jgi:hypothetical protein